MSAGFIIDGWSPPEYMSSSTEVDLLSLCYSDVDWDLADVVFFSFLDKPKGTNYCYYYYYYYYITLTLQDHFFGYIPIFVLLLVLPQKF